MHARLFKPRYSILARGLALLALFITALKLFYGDAVGGRSVLARTVLELGFFSESAAELIDQIIPALTLAVSLATAIRRGSVYFAVLTGIATYTLTTLSLVLAASALSILHAGVSGWNSLLGSAVLPATILCFTATIAVSYVYPQIAVGFKVVSATRTSKKSIVGDAVKLEAGDVLRVVVYGDESNIAVSCEPKDTCTMKNREKTLTYTYVDLLITSSLGSTVKVYYKDKLAAAVKCVYEKLEYHKLVFEVYFNDDYVGEYEVNAEVFKDLTTAFQPVLEAALAKIGVSVDKVRAVQFYSEDGVLIPSSTPVSDVKAGKLKARIYASEKILELLKHYTRRDLYALWESLLKRLEALHETAGKLLEQYNTVLQLARVIGENVW